MMYAAKEPQTHRSGRRPPCDPAGPSPRCGRQREPRAAGSAGRRHPAAATLVRPPSCPVLDSRPPPPLSPHPEQAARLPDPDPDSERWAGSVPTGAGPPTRAAGGERRARPVRGPVAPGACCGPDPREGTSAGGARSRSTGAARRGDRRNRAGPRAGRRTSAAADDCPGDPPCLSHHDHRTGIRNPFFDLSEQVGSPLPMKPRGGKPIW
jgi:hypothetical protein